MPCNSFQSVSDAPDSAVDASAWDGIMALGLHGPPPPSVSYRGDTYTLVSAVPSTYRGIKSSAIWDHGDRYTSSRSSARCWRCKRCGTMVSYLASTTTNPVKHMKSIHPGVLQAVTTLATATEISPATLSRSSSPAISHVSTRASSTPISEIPRFWTQRTILQPPVDIEQWRNALLRWIISEQLPFRTVESPLFHRVLTLLHSPIESYLISGKSIANWLQVDYMNSVEQVRDWLRVAASRIHISFDIWTSPNGYAMIGIIAHAVEATKTCVQHVLLGLKRLRGGHSGIEVGQVLVDTLSFWGIAGTKLGVLVSDNPDINDVATRFVIQALVPGATQRRARCAAHIINLAAKAYLFGKEVEAFSDIDGEEGSLIDLQKAQETWRKRGSIGKLHNIVVFIRASSQRREVFKAKQFGNVETDSKSAYFSQSNPLNGKASQQPYASHPTINVVLSTLANNNIH
jgi:hypothetical protein